ncbi:hypothetical protein D9C73_018429 [Collichthys lucidus]|uniref:Secreted protein n=1 Tax=Collichthys lucidus TaxID=240159 RepID=A0A4U5V9W0_COLLU|nr:hypothetical protein D9C73_018429 [Collichthys lucidus]
MSRYFSVWVSFGMLPPLLLAVGAIVCSEKETLLKPIPGTVTQLTDCLMECTGMTYIKKLQLRDTHNIRLKDSTEAGHQMLEVRTTIPSSTTLHAHNSPTTIAESCGRRYDVTQHFSTETTGDLFCVQVVARGNNVLKCPPYLVTFWQRSPNQSNQEGGG